MTTPRRLKTAHQLASEQCRWSGCDVRLSLALRRSSQHYCLVHREAYRQLHHQQHAAVQLAALVHPPSPAPASPAHEVIAARSEERAGTHDSTEWEDEAALATGSPADVPRASAAPTLQQQLSPQTQALADAADQAPMAVDESPSHELTPMAVSESCAASSSSMCRVREELKEQEEAVTQEPLRRQRRRLAYSQADSAPDEVAAVATAAAHSCESNSAPPYEREIIVVEDDEEEMQDEEEKMEYEIPLRADVPEHARDPKRCLREYGFAFVPSFGRAFALLFRKLMTKAVLAKLKKQIISGGVWQYFLPPDGDSEWPTQLRAGWHKLVKQLADYLEVDLLQVAYHVQDEKLLIAAIRRGEQAPHLDRDDDISVMKHTYTVILYLSDGADSTAFPTYKQDQFAVPQFIKQEDGEGEPEELIANQAQMRATVEHGCLNERSYERWPVQCGDMSLFSQALMHFGTRNPLTHEQRWALFSVFTPYGSLRQDDYQMFRWMYVNHAFGTQSRQLAEAVWRDRRFDPLGRFERNTQAGRQSYDAFVTSLLRWGFIDWQPPAKSASEAATGRWSWAPASQRRNQPLPDEDVQQIFEHGTSGSGKPVTK